ncbi:DNA ligase [Vibrio sp. FNV 38]|nr:DNA ligase [Vibrio sp. FNV 38]
MLLRHTLIALAITSSFHTQSQLNNHKIGVMLAKNYHSSVDVSQYWVSEKLDGIRAYWDGHQLLTRNGHEIHAPKWFIDPLPSFSVEGELWAGRENFHLVHTTVLDHKANDAAWRNVGFHLFDIPYIDGDFYQRYKQLKQWFDERYSTGKYDHLKLVEQHSISSKQELEQHLITLSDQGAEGLMLRLIKSPYIEGRSDALLKMKTYQDREAFVIGYKMGKGKYTDHIGALLVRNLDGVEFYLGSGLTDQQRKHPPEIGKQVTYRFNGLTEYGKPKFPRLLRERTTPL